MPEKAEDLLGDLDVREVDPPQPQLFAESPEQVLRPDKAEPGERLAERAADLLLERERLLELFLRDDARSNELFADAQCLLFHGAALPGRGFAGRPPGVATMQPARKNLKGNTAPT